MSQTFELVCHETKQRIWIGQGHGEMTSFYSGEPETMQRLGRFFIATRGKALVLMCTDTQEGDWLEYEDFEAPPEDA